MTALEDRPTVAVDQCDHCGSKNLSLALNATPWTLMRCTKCDFVFTSPRLTEEALSSIYSDEYYENSANYAAQQVEPPSNDHLSLAKSIFAQLRRRGTKPVSMDVGCGGGRLVEAFSMAGFDAYGIEPSENTVQVAREVGRNISVTDVSELPDATYDCVTAMHVLEHVISPSEFTSELFRITRPGGLCIVEVPNFGSKAARQQGADWYALHPSTHLSHFTPDSLTGFMQKSGFQVRSIQRLGGAGVFATVSEATARKMKIQASTPAGGNVTRRVLGAVWSFRSAVTSIPAARRLARWVNWELLGQGEFVRSVVWKPAS